MRTLRFLALLVTTLSLLPAARAQGARFTPFGSGCPGSRTTTCPSNNANATRLEGRLPGPNRRVALRIVARTPLVQGFELFTRSRSGSTVPAWIYLADATGKPRANPHATGTLNVTTQLGWQKATFKQPVSLGANTTYFLSWDRGTTQNPTSEDPIARTGATSEHYELRNGSWVGLLKDRWAFRVQCTLNQQIPAIFAQSEPYYGNSKFAIEVKDARATTAAILIVGASNKTWNRIPLPLDLRVVGATGCKLLVSFDLLFGTATDAGGRGRVGLPIPNDRRLRGVAFYGQWMTADSGANQLGFAFSDGAICIIGDAE